jgi:hypothetical protein
MKIRLDPKYDIEGKLLTEEVEVESLEIVQGGAYFHVRPMLINDPAIEVLVSPTNVWLELGAGNVVRVHAFEEFKEIGVITIKGLTPPGEDTSKID